jgi:hypothetical protein
MSRKKTLLELSLVKNPDLILYTVDVLDALLFCIIIFKWGRGGGGETEATYATRVSTPLVCRYERATLRF